MSDSYRQMQARRIRPTYAASQINSYEIIHAESSVVRVAENYLANSYEIIHGDAESSVVRELSCNLYSQRTIIAHSKPAWALCPVSARKIVDILPAGAAHLWPIRYSTVL